MSRQEGQPRRSGPLMRRGTVLMLSGLMVILDQLSKHWMTSMLRPGESAPFIPGLLQLHLVRNTGAAFSLFTGATPMLGLLSLVVAIGVAIWIWREPRHELWMGLALGFLLGGTIGNGIDRLRLGHVTDFLELVPIQFPIFNWADVAINLAVLCFAIDALTTRKGPRDA